MAEALLRESRSFVASIAKQTHNCHCECNEVLGSGFSFTNRRLVYTL
jgi:hypothetical protein